jgi:hypothetical protein
MLGGLRAFVPFLAGFGSSGSLLRPVIPEYDFLLAVNQIDGGLQAFQHVSKEFGVTKLRHAAALLGVIGQLKTQD